MMNKRPVLLSVLIIMLLFSLPAQARDKILDIQEVKTPGGLTAWLVEDHTLPIISLEFAFAGAGASLDPADKQGRSLLLSNTLDEGAGDYDSEAFQKALSDHSISLRFSNGRDDFYGSLTTLTRYKDKGFELTKLALTKPRFDEEPLERMRAANLSRLRSSLSKPNWIAARIMNDKGFEGHPYALNSGGTMTTLAELTAEDLRAFKDSYLTKDRLMISAAGDITAEELAAVLDDIFGDLPAKGESANVPDQNVTNGGETFLYERDIPQTIISIWQPGTDHKNPDYFAVKIMNFILGGSGFGSRLMEEVREKRGLSYGIYSGLQMMDHIDAYSVSTSTRNETTAEVLDLIKTEFKKIQDTPISDKELAEAKSYLIGSIPLALSSTDKISGLLLTLQTSKLPIDYLDRQVEALQNVTKEDVQRAAKTLLQPDKLTTILVGNPENITPTETIKTLPNVE